MRPGTFLVALVVGFCLVLGPAGQLYAQEYEPEPYTREEFPQWARDLRRAEIVAVGTFPIAVILSGVVYQLGRFGYHSLEAGRADMNYAPWFLSTGTGERYNEDERIGLIISGVTLSAVVAVIDYVLGRVERARMADTDGSVGTSP